LARVAVVALRDRRYYPPVHGDVAASRDQVLVIPFEAENR